MVRASFGIPRGRCSSAVPRQQPSSTRWKTIKVSYANNSAGVHHVFILHSVALHCGLPRLVNSTHHTGWGSMLEWCKSSTFRELIMMEYAVPASVSRAIVAFIMTQRHAIYHVAQVAHLCWILPELANCLRDRGADKAGNHVLLPPNRCYSGSQSTQHRWFVWLRHAPSTSGKSCALADVGYVIIFPLWPHLVVSNSMHASFL